MNGHIRRAYKVHNVPLIVPQGIPGKIVGIPLPLKHEAVGPIPVKTFFHLSRYLIRNTGCPYRGKQVPCGYIAPVMVLTGKDGPVPSHNKGAAALKCAGLRHLFRDGQGLQPGLQHPTHAPPYPDRLRNRENRLASLLLPVPNIGYNALPLFNLMEQIPVTLRYLLVPQPFLQLFQGQVFYHVIPVLQIKLFQIPVQGILRRLRDNLFSQS